jgi:APA family basic amino acid/polyamine antiporter
MAAIAGAFWAYDGWNNITFVAGEIKDPQKNIPKSLFAGSVFLHHHLRLDQPRVYLCILPVDQLAGSAFVASDTAVKLPGALSVEH